MLDYLVAGQRVIEIGFPFELVNLDVVLLPLLNLDLVEIR